MNFADQLFRRVLELRNPCLVGLDPHLDRIPEEFTAIHSSDATRAEMAADLVKFFDGVIEVISDLVPAVKPQSAFFEALGVAGVEAWEQVVKRAHQAGLLVIGDVKRGDIGSTAAAYAQAFLTGMRGTDPETLCDCITINPYLGSDSIEPFLEACKSTGKGLYVLVRTSNPGSSEFQLQGTPTLSELVADAVVRWGEDLVGESGYSSVGAVVGATHPEDLAQLRKRMPKVPFLIPGYGAQGGGAAELAPAFGAHFAGGLVNSSRGILYAKRSESQSWKDAVRCATEAMIAEFRALNLNPVG
ncbi:MAG: orotidine-5'-phosphate decarboxylase [Planctomycetes bacterium]|nr:orotidine-5'-phosphate decarboxylase [Planctomycetota bacterium]